MNTKEEIFTEVAAILAEEFELEKSSISMSVNLYHELGLDSIDAVDLVIRLQDLSGKKIDPQTFKEVRTVEDVVVAIEDLLKLE